MLHYLGHPMKFIINDGTLVNGTCKPSTMTLINEKDVLVLRPICCIKVKEQHKLASIGGHVNFDEITMSNNGYWVLWNKTKKRKFIYFVDMTNQQVEYLRHVGVDYPHYLLNGKTLFESGLCIYNKK